MRYGRAGGEKRMFGYYLAGFPAFISHFGLAVVFVVLFVAIYTRVTAHDEFALIREGNIAAAIALGGSLVGFSLVLSSAVEHSVSIIDNILWAAISLAIQLVVYALTRLTIRDLTARIDRGDLAAALWLAACSFAGGQIAAASMTT